MPGNRITASEAAAKLGVKRQTIYAYVSRGMLESHRDIDGKSSLFDPADIARLQRGRRSARRGRLEVPISTSITNVTDGRVEYRGISINSLAAERRSFESVASLLWRGELQGHSPWVPPKNATRHARRAVKALGADARRTDMMMTALVSTAAHDPFRGDTSPNGVASCAADIITVMVDSMPPTSASQPDNGTPPQTPIGARLWKRLTAADPSSSDVLDLALVLLADHGLATSTLAARLAASTRGGAHAVTLAGLGAVAGPLHGGASRLVHEMFTAAWEHGADSAIAEAIRRHDQIPGLGHPIHRSADPRHDILFAAIENSSLPADRAKTVRSVVARISDRYDIAPNIDLALGALTFIADMAPDAGEIVFSVARTAGWIAHALEEYEEPPLRFRAVGRYSAPSTSRS